MSGNALIPLMGEPMNLGRSVLSGAVAGNQLLTLAENRRNAPLAREAAKMEVESGKIKLSKEKAIEQLRNAAIDGSYIRRDLASGDLKTAISRMEQRNRRIIEAGGDNQHTQQWLAALSSGDPAQIQAVGAEMAEIERAYQQYGGGGGMGGASAAEREFQAMTAGMSPQDVEKARRIAMGLDPRAMGSSSITIAQQGLTDPVAASQGVIAGSVAGAQQAQKAAYAGDIAANAAAGANAADMGMTGAPARADVEAAVAQAKAQVDAEANQNATARANAIALDGYNAAMSGLEQALGNTAAGYFAGRVPPVGADAQIAEGSIAAMAPVLKQLFRVSGEGVFTDKDQQLLLDMVPKRTDETEAQKAKISNINAIVRAKLGQGAQAQQSQPVPQTNPMEGKTAVNPQTGQRLIMRDGQWVAQ
jgi:hypothetical protein